MAGGKVVWPLLVGGLIVAALALAAGAVLRMDPWGEGESGLSSRFVFSADEYQRAEPALIAFAEQGSFATELGTVHGLAIGADDRVYVAGDGKIRTFGADGRRMVDIPIEGIPRCLAVGRADDDQPERLYAGLEKRIVLFDAEGAVIAGWTDGLDDKSVLTSLAIGEDSLFAADAGNRVVLRYDFDGALLGRIGQADPGRGIRGFIIPSPHFDVAVTADGLVRVANPGARRIETYTADGDLLGHWGKASAEIEGFFGCCNPADFTVLPDGRFVTAEKGIPRVKIYGPQGELECVVADPQMLGQSVSAGQLEQDSGHAPTFDVAVDGRGRVLVLDSPRREVRVFVRKTANGQEEGTNGGSDG